MSLKHHKEVTHNLKSCPDCGKMTWHGKVELCGTCNPNSDELMAFLAENKSTMAAFSQQIQSTELQLSMLREHWTRCFYAKDYAERQIVPVRIIKPRQKKDTAAKKKPAELSFEQLIEQVTPAQMRNFLAAQEK